MRGTLQEFFKKHREKVPGGVPVLKKSRWLLLKREENLKTETALPVALSAPIQPEDRTSLPSEGSLSAALGLQLARLSRKVPR